MARAPKGSPGCWSEASRGFHARATAVARRQSLGPGPRRPLQGIHARPGDMPADVRAPVPGLWPLGVSTHGRQLPPDVRAPALGRMVASAGRRKGRRARRGRRRGRREAGRGAEPEHQDHDSVRNRCDCTQLRQEVGAQGGRGSPGVPTPTCGRCAVAPVKPPAHPSRIHEGSLRPRPNRSRGLLCDRTRPLGGVGRRGERCVPRVLPEWSVALPPPLAPKAQVAQGKGSQGGTARRRRHREGREVEGLLGRGPLERTEVTPAKSPAASLRPALRPKLIVPRAA